MKINNKIWLALASGLFLAGCADQDIDIYTVEKPESIAQYEYLKAYDNLKEYVSQRAGVNPDFKLGCGVLASDYNQYGMVYRVTNANFNIITAGNAMKYASVVGDDGVMNTSTVVDFVRAAEEAGTEVYGHTFCWHEQQRPKYLNRLIKDRELEIDPDAKNEVEDAIQKYAGMNKFPYFVMGYEPDIIDGILTAEYLDGWYQFFVMDDLSFVEGREYTVTAKIRGSKAGELNIQLGNWGALQEKKLQFTDEWSEASAVMPAQTVANGFCVFQPGTYDGKLEIEWVRISHSEAPSVEVENEVTFKTYEDGPFPFYAMGCEPPVINGCIHFEPNGSWSQFFILPGGENQLKEGNYVVYLDITASKAVPSGIQLTMQNGWGGDAQNISVNIALEEGHNNVRVKMSDVAGGNYDIILKPQTTDAILDLRSVTVCKVESLNSIPLTPEEKYEILEAEMARWIQGMMAATEGKVKCWDVVNEAISGTMVGDRYDLQRAERDPDAANKFYWQDYLGDNFVRVPVKYARQYFEENGGNPEDLKLFINDYNLESDWDDNQKLKSLIKWIEQWESDGVTKIDGIGSQMHISYYMNPAVQESKANHIVKMFELMAASGKLVRITEFDMGLVGEDGKDIPTAEVTFEQHQLMAEYYKFIIDKYFEIIPAAQQHGITFWCQTDSPKDSGWRANTPVGIWNSNFDRKPAYAGIADGLAGK